MSGPLDFLALEKSVADLLERFDALNSQSEERFNLVLKGSEATLERIESLESARAPDLVAADARVDVNRRLDLIEADVIDRAEETHKRITALVNTTGNALDSVRERVQVLTDRVATSNSQWGELYDRVGRFEGRVDELIDLCDGDAKLGAQLKQRIDDLESSNLIAVQVAEGHTGSMVLLEKLSEKRFTTSVELVDALRKDAGL